MVLQPLLETYEYKYVSFKYLMRPTRIRLNFIAGEQSG